MTFSVSVIIPVFNAERFIEKTINSALQQPEVTEIVVVNDGSTDNTLNIIENLQIENSTIQICHHKNKVNKGRSSTRNLGIKKATGSFLAMGKERDEVLNKEFPILINDLKEYYRLKRIIRNLRKSKKINWLIRLGLIEKF